MLIKEYHIPLPLSLEEYKIAQLYMIQKKSREESEGEDSGVEILENRPYTDGPFDSGQYTYKVYHIGRHIPSWLRGMVPKTALEVHEESWNAYPKTRTKFSVPFVEKFTLEIDTIFQQDNGSQENIFNLSRAEQRNREVDVIDMVNDSLAGSDYKSEEDPSLYHSTKTGRGPLSEDWIQNPPNGVIMCSYKLIKVDFRYWGLQSKVERLIHDYGLRRVMLRAHRQAWAWQDEWVGLTMEDIRRLELETKLILQRKLGRLTTADTADDEMREEDHELDTVSHQSSAIVSTERDSRRISKQLTSSFSFSDSAQSPAAPAAPQDLQDDSLYCALHNIAIHEDSDSEYFDAKEVITDEEDDQDLDSDDFLVHSSAPVSSNVLSSPPLPIPPRQHLLLLNDHNVSMDAETDDELEDTPHRPHKGTALLLVVSAGNGLVLDSDEHKIDLETLKSTFEEVYSTHYSNSLEKIAIRFVSCTDFTSSVRKLLQSITLSKSCSSSSSMEHCPLAALPLLAMDDPSYCKSLDKLIEEANTVYRQFLDSEEGRGFNQEVCLLADCFGSLMVYDMLTQRFDDSLARLGRGRLRNSPVSISVSHLETLKGTEDDGILRSHSVPSSTGSDHAHRPLLPPVIKESVSQDHVSLAFEVSRVFSFGSPLGLILARKQLKGEILAKPSCGSFYNIFYTADPLAFRLEPLLDQEFSLIDPLFIPSYLQYPTGDQSLVSLLATVSSQSHLFDSTHQLLPSASAVVSRRYNSTECLFESSEENEKQPFDVGLKPFSVWWGYNRIDYQLEALSNIEHVKTLPDSSFGHIMQARYWEAKEMASFVLRQVLQGARGGASMLATPTGKRGPWVPFVPPTSIVKWAKRKTPLRIQKMSPNHRAIDLVIASQSSQLPLLQAKFSYGPLNMATLSGEMVSMYILRSNKFPGLEETPQPVSSSRQWVYLDSTSTSKHGRLQYPLSPDQCPVDPGIYPIIFLVKGDHTLAHSNLFIIPPHTEAVVFSIDGALCSNFSISGRDMKLKSGSVETTRMWQEKGYFIIYITGRPIIQKDYIISWLAVHQFPMGVVSFSDTLSTDSQNTKLLYLARLIKEAKVILCAAYGSHRHLSIYKELGLQSDQIYLHRPKNSAKSRHRTDYQVLTDGFRSHLLSFRPRPAMVDVNKLLGSVDFSYSQLNLPHDST